MTGDDRPLRTAVIGMGHFGAVHARKLADLPSVELVGVADTRPERAEAVARELGVAAAASHRALPDGLDAVVVATTTSAHCEVATTFLEAGVDVFIEKPIAATLAEADRLIEIAAARSAILQIGHIERFGGLYGALRTTVERPLFVEAVRIAPFTNRGLDVSVVLDIMIHDIDLILGLVDAPLASARAVGAPVFSPNDDIASARLEFANGCVANLTASRISFKTERRMRFFEQDRYVTVDFDQRSLRIVRRGPGDPGTAEPAVAFDEVQLPDGDPLADELASFVAAARGRSRPRVSGEDGRTALAAAILIADGMREHRALVRRNGLIGDGTGG